MSQLRLGRLELVEPRDIWTYEDADFTPWLTEAANLKLLGDTLGIQLEFPATELHLGACRADIVCQDRVNGRIVLIENQLEATDHKHLGQLLTYCAGLQAAVMVWIASRFTDEHRTAIHWLNQFTHEQQSFFALEVQAWRIGDSLPAPRFNVVASPTSWRHDPTYMSIEQTYWLAFKEYSEQHPQLGPIALREDGRGWCNDYRRFPGGRFGTDYYVSVGMKNRWIGAEIYFEGDGPMRYGNWLHSHLDELKSDFKGTGTLIYKPLPLKNGTAACACIGVFWEDVATKDREKWPEQHDWLCTNLLELRRVMEIWLDRIDSLQENSIL